MASGGWYRMHRGWQDDPLFAGDIFSRRDAWEWIIARAAWEPHARWFKGHKIQLDRGEVATSERELCEAWKWERQRVRTFLRQLETDEKLTRETTQGITKLSVCNYIKYQTEQPSEQPTSQPAPNPELTSTQPTIEEEKEREEGKEGKNVTAPDGAPPYAFEGRVIRLLPDQFDRWRIAYPALDLQAVLQSRDDWLADEADEASRKRWFMATSNHLANLQQKATAAKQEAVHDRARITV